MAHELLIIMCAVLIPTNLGGQLMSSSDMDSIVEAHNQFREKKGRQKLESQEALSGVAEEEAASCKWDPDAAQIIRNNITYAVNQFAWQSGANGLGSAVDQWVKQYPVLCSAFPYPEIQQLCGMEETAMSEGVTTIGCGVAQCENLQLLPFNKDKENQRLLYCLYQ